jgi:hypothetical protein
MSDIVDPAVVKQVYREEIKKVQEQVKESDDKWQDVSITTASSTLRNTSPLQDT